MKTKLRKWFLGMALLLIPIVGQAQSYDITAPTEDGYVSDPAVITTNNPYLWGFMKLGKSAVDGSANTTSAIIPFRLPARPAGKKVETASLKVYVSYGREWLNANVDLYGLPFVPENDQNTGRAIHPEDHYAGPFAATQGSRGAVGIEDDYFAKNVEAGKLDTPRWEQTTEDQKLAAYINAQYDAGAKEGDWIFLRLSMDDDDMTGAQYFKVEGGDSDTPATLQINFDAGPVNNPPVLAAIDDQQVEEKQVLDLNISASDADGDALTFSATNLPAFAVLTDNGDGTALIKFSPNEGDAGTYNGITVTVSDGKDTDEKTFVLTVSPVTAPGDKVEEVYAAVEDNGVYGNGTLTTTKTDGWVARPQHFVGGLKEYNPNKPDDELDNYDGAAVFPFLLPAIPAGMLLKDASFSVNIEATSATWGTINIDLYGLDARPEATVLGDDFFSGTYGADTKATGIQALFIPDQSPVGRIETTTEGKSKLTEFIQSQYDAGKAGQYIFLRVNPNVENVTTYLRVQITSADNTDPALQPKLVLTFKDDSTAAVEDIDKGALGIYPNPVNDGNLRVSLDGFNKNANLKIYSITGKLVHKVAVKNSNDGFFETKINLTPGLYIVKLNDGERSKTQKLIVQ